MANSPEITPFERFLRLLRPDRKEVRDIYIYAAFHGLVSLSLPLGIQAIINLIQGGRISTSFVVLVVIVVLGIVVTGILQVQQLRITENIQQNIFTRAAFEFAYRIPHIRMRELQAHYAPELMNRFFDTMSVQKGLSKILIEFSVATLQILFGLILLSLYHPFFILFSFFLLLLVYAIFRFTAKPGLRASLNESHYKYRLAHWLEELARTAVTFKLAGRSTLPFQRTDEEVEKYLEHREKHFRILVQQYGLMIAFKALVATGLLAIGGVLVMEQMMNIGQFVAAEIIIILIMNSVEKLVLTLESVYDVLTALEKIGQVTDLELEDTPTEEDSGDVKKNGGMEVEFRSVSFSYPGSKKLTIQDLDLVVGTGVRHGVCGPNGSGKSSLMHLLSGIYEVDEGHLIYDGHPLDSYDLMTLRGKIGDSLNHQQIFEGTLFENIAMGRSKASRENVEWVIEELGVTDFLKSSKKGIHEPLDPNGRKLPLSLVQKILLARAVVDMPRLLLLERAFDLIDPKERERIADFLFSRERPWTLVVASNDPEVLERCDRVTLLKEGKQLDTAPFDSVRDRFNELVYA